MWPMGLLFIKLSSKTIVVVVAVVYFDKNYIEHKAHIKCTHVKNYKTHVHKMRAKCHVISTRDNTKSK